MTMKQFIARYNSTTRNEKGASMLEYALLGALIAVAGISAVSSLGEAARYTLNDTGETLAAANGVINPEVPER